MLYNLLCILEFEKINSLTLTLTLLPASISGLHFYNHWPSLGASPKILEIPCNAAWCLFFKKNFRTLLISF